MLKHTFQSAKSDGADATLIRPSNWNREHTWDEGAHQNLLMRDTGGVDGASWQALIDILAQLVTTRGDLVTRDATTVIRRALGLTKQYLKSDGTDNVWDYVKSLQESGGPTVLDVGAIVDGQFVKRVGTNLQSAAVADTLPSEFVSSDQTVTLSSVLSVAHGLGAMPKLVQVSLKCATAEGGFSAGDEIVLYGTVSEVNASGHAMGVSKDATNVVIATGSSLSVYQKGSATPFTITAANWRYVIRAWI